VLTVRADTTGGKPRAALTWSDSTAQYVIYRDGQVIDDSDGGGSYTDRPPRGTTLATYRVCLVGDPTRCSNSVTVTW
jgi:hypothetical protein